MDSKVARQTSARLGLGGELQRLRKRKGVTQGAVAQAAGLTRDRISKLESGKTSLSADEIAAILTFLDASAEEATALHELADRARKRRRLTRAESARKHTALIPPEHRRRIDMESEATAIWSYNAGLLPLEIQSPDYMRMLLTAGDGVFWPPSEDGIANRVKARLDRQNSILRSVPPKSLRLIFSEEALLTHRSTSEIMKGQLAYIVGLAEELPNLSMHMIETADPRNPARDGALSVLEFSGAARIAFTQVVYGASQCLRKKTDTDAIMRVMDRLREIAYSPTETLELIRKKLQEL
ncbi:helix-turn-helix domain-containing protein [Crossiella sp. CA198]|uniref:helix-turn-helix domain-containing protein n=1 Tax=Crossiella sp. CA198 TaxID=3455607 RepID=UPI003F8D0201